MITKQEFLEQIEQSGVVEWSPGYANSRYSSPKNGIYLANWNDFPDIMNLKESTIKSWGYAIEWSDEWVTCDACYNIFSTTPAYYGDLIRGAIWDSSVLCERCLKSDPDEYLLWLEDNPKHAMTARIGLKSRGYIHYDNPENRYTDNFEAGLHIGQDDDPQKIARQLRAAGINRFLFTIDGQGQFDTDFSLWIHKSQWRLMPGINAHGFDAGKAAEAALRGAIQEINNGI